MYDSDEEPPLYISHEQLKRALELADRASERAKQDSQPRIHFKRPTGMRKVSDAVVADVSVYRGGGDDYFEQLIAKDGEVLLEWSSDERRAT